MAPTRIIPHLACTLLTASLLFLGAAWPAQAQIGKMTPERLQSLIKEATDDPEEIKFARPMILGFPAGATVSTRQATRKAPNTNYYFAVVMPRIENGLFFFKGTEKPYVYIMHRTDAHLRRVVSARNLDGKLSAWSGKAADDDFRSQINFWATVKD